MTVNERPDMDDLPHRDWKCEACGASNSCLDGECQYCDAGDYMICDRCGQKTENPEDDYGEFICDSCRDNENEKAAERHYASFYDGTGIKTLTELMAEARRVK